MTLLQFWPHYLRGLLQIAAIALGSGVCALPLAAVVYAAGKYWSRGGLPDTGGDSDD
jgi:hypothetical protein